MKLFLGVLIAVVVTGLIVFGAICLIDVLETMK